MKPKLFVLAIALLLPSAFAAATPATDLDRTILAIWQVESSGRLHPGRRDRSAPDPPRQLDRRHAVHGEGLGLQPGQ